jgi:predicted MFS family arabinose efflux permease
MSVSASPGVPSTSADISFATLIALIVGITIGDMSLFIVPLLVGGLIETYGLSEGQVGLVIAFRLGALALASFILSARIHRVDRRLFAFIGVALVIAGNLGAAFADTSAGYIFWRMVMGVGEGVILTVITAIGAASRNPEKIFAILSFWLFAGSILIFLVAPPVLGAFGIRTTFILVAAVAAALSPVFLFITREKSADTNLAPTRFTWSSASIGVLAAVLLLSVGANSAWFYLERIGERMGMSLAEVGNALVIVAVVALLGPLIAHQANTRFGRLKPIVLGFVVLAAAAILMTHTRSPLVYTAGISFSSIGLAFTSIYLLGIASVLDSHGRLAAACRGFLAIGNAVAPGIGGSILLLGGNYELIGWAAVIASFLAIAVASPGARLSDRRARADAQPAVT